MKALKQFLQFDLDGFLADKEITFLDAKPYYLYENGKATDEVAGMKLECVITRDDTNYNNKEISNEYYKRGEAYDSENSKWARKLGIEGGFTVAICEKLFSGSNIFIISALS